MTRLAWDAVDERIYEFGVDRGVLYPHTGDGVVWNGLVAVTEQAEGGSIESYYVDGIKYLDRSTTEDFKATIEAFTYPDEFAAADGSLAMGNGLRVTSQRRKRFGLSYRTKIASPTNETLGYKIHIINNAMVEPTERQNQTVGAQFDPLNFSWSISTRPDVVRGYRPTGHLILDSRDCPEALLATIEGILYGTETTAPRLPTAGEFIFLVDSYLSEIYDAGFIEDPVYELYEGGDPTGIPVLEPLDFGGP